VVKRAISLGCDEGPRERELVSRLLACLHPDPLTDGEMEAGFGMVLDAIEELTIDIPDAKVRRLFCFFRFRRPRRSVVDAASSSSRDRSTSFFRLRRSFVCLVVVVAESVVEGRGRRKNTDRKGFARRKGGENRETRKKRTVREDE